MLVGLLLVSSALAFAEHIPVEPKVDGMLETDIGRDSCPALLQVATNRRKLEVLQSGAPWDDGEVLTVLSKLNKVFLRPSSVAREVLDGGNYECQENRRGVLSNCPNNRLTNSILPRAPKFLRLGFHDCMKYEDGTGGCDGCLNLENVFVKFKAETEAFEDTTGGRNNNLAMTADVLEKIYTDPSFPSNTPTLNQSLQSSGKSRADLWALATLAAAHHGMETNNAQCTSSSDKKGHLANEIGYSCEISPSNPLLFTFGRTDCHSSMKADENDESMFYRRRAYESLKREDLPSDNGDGRTTAQYLRNGFNLSVRETVAIMGAHSFGKFHVDTSLHKYDWTRGQIDLLNNEYYRIISLKPSFAKQTDSNTWRVVGGPGRTPTNWTGALAETRWMVRAFRFKRSGGPFGWSHQYKRCADCYYENNQWIVREPSNGGSSYFRSTHCCEECTKQPNDDTIDPRCFTYISQDEEALGADAGLYVDFAVDAASGRPQNNDNTCGFPATNRRWRNTAPGCPFQMYEDDGQPMHEIVEEYAENQDTWFNDFSQSLGKMLANGADNLSTNGAFSFEGVTCASRGTLECVKGSGR